MSSNAYTHYTRVEQHVGLNHLDLNYGVTETPLRNKRYCEIS